MKPRRTHESDGVLSLPGGTEDNDLWFQRGVTDDGQEVVVSTWEPTPEEREAIAAGANLELVVWRPVTAFPPVALGTSSVPLGKAPTAPQGGSGNGLYWQCPNGHIRQLSPGECPTCGAALV